MIKEFKTFIAVARDGTFTGAGAQLGLTQSAVSAQIKRLEDYLGVALFDRGARAAVLNAHGREMLPQAEELVAMAEPIDGHRAVALGLANRAVPAADVMPQALAFAERLAGWEAAAMGLTKRAFHRCADLGLEDALGVGRDANVIMRGFRQGASR